jgi:hypothetical protein
VQSTPQINASDVATAAAIRAVGAIKSAYDQRMSLMHVVGQGKLDEHGWLAVIDTAARINSDYDRAEALTTIAAAMPLDDATRAAYRKAADAIVSEYDRSRAQGALYHAGLDRAPCVIPRSIHERSRLAQARAPWVVPDRPLKMGHSFPRVTCALMPHFVCRGMSPFFTPSMGRLRAALPVRSHARERLHPRSARRRAVPFMNVRARRERYATQVALRFVASAEVRA